MKSVNVSGKAALRVKSGHPWIYRTDLLDTPKLARGEPVLVFAEARKGRDAAPLGTGVYSSTSTLAIRLASRRVETLDAAWMEKRLSQALELRKRAWGGAPPPSYRWVHGEADGVPGLVVDRFGDHVSFQVLCQGTDVLQDAIIAAINKLANPKTLVLRNDVPSRTKEDLPVEKRVLRGDTSEIAYDEGKITLTIDLLEGQKTGTFLDQQENHVLAGTLAKGRALDCFSGDGGFALQMGLRADSVLAVESSAPAVQRIVANAKANHLSNITAEEANAFDFLRAQAQKGELYDTIVVDPPAFAKGKAHLEAALRGYKELNLRAMKMLRPGGILVTCSCSQPVDGKIFEDMLQHAAADAGKNVQVLMRRGAGPDHPAMLGFPESSYLKCFVLSVSS